MKAAVVTFPGSNNDHDVLYTLGQFFETVDNLWHKDTPDLSGYDLVALPGGFSPGAAGLEHFLRADVLRHGALAGPPFHREAAGPAGASVGLRAWLTSLGHGDPASGFTARFFPSELVFFLLGLLSYRLYASWRPGWREGAGSWALAAGAAALATIGAQKSVTRSRTANLMYRATFIELTSL